jgi:hypothetical protein
VKAGITHSSLVVAKDVDVSVVGVDQKTSGSWAEE